jgi:hypothetical protein
MRLLVASLLGFPRAWSAHLAFEVGMRLFRLGAWLAARGAGSLYELPADDLDTRLLSGMAFFRDELAAHLGAMPQATLPSRPAPP